MIPSVKHLAALRDDPAAFEAERNRILNEYIASLPERHQRSARSQQLRVDTARSALNDEELLAWFQLEAQELAANIDDLFLSISHKAQDIKKLSQ